jgi:hypothetical protein
MYVNGNGVPPVSFTKIDCDLLLKHHTSNSPALEAIRLGVIAGSNVVCTNYISKLLVPVVFPSLFIEFFLPRIGDLSTL